jgi:glyoxylase-like metal-dependent hydrolase (beta-lactamase superfamily II)
MGLLRTHVTRQGRFLIQISRYVTNCYLVREDDGLTLIDCAWPRSAAAILAAANDAGGPIRRIALTHAHNDHTGSLESLCGALPDSDVLVGARESRFLNGDFRLLSGEPAGRLRRFVYRQSDIEPDGLLEAGDRVGSLEVIDAKGHTPGQIGFLDTRDGTLICGDAYLTVGKPFICTERAARFPIPALIGTWHGPTAVATARALRALEPARLATGHGRVVDRPVGAMAEALARVHAPAMSSGAA